MMLLAALPVLASIAGAAALSVSPAHAAARSLLSRQTFDAGDIPAACQSSCTPALTELSTCDTADTCCSNGQIGLFVSCVNCLVDEESSTAAALAQGQGLLDSYSDLCTLYDVNTGPLIIGGSSSGSASATGSATAPATVTAPGSSATATGFVSPSVLIPSVISTRTTAARTSSVLDTSAVPSTTASSSSDSLPGLSGGAQSFIQKSMAGVAGGIIAGMALVWA
ncbi:hypothetical protein OF83DRAFT_1175113 [Amylostereum chailletii]|nr:hypothetical protein OF83DRAFT_1175113 [Amylostereum chailletii]